MQAQRTLIIGCPGSGKSHLARALGELTGMRVVHLDLLYWNPDKTTVSREEFSHRLKAELKGERWIMDGNYASTLELRLQRSDAVVLLDFPLEVCLQGLLARMHRPRPDMPWIETEYDAEFLEFVRGFSRNVLPGMLQILAAYPDKRITILRSRAEIQAYLNAVKEAASI